MKKLMIAAAIVCAAAFAQAASVQWMSSAINGVALASLDGDGTYNASGSALKGNGSISYLVTFYVAGTDTVADSISGTSLVTGSKITVTKNLTGLSLSTTYDYVVTMTATQTDLNKYSDDNWDYANATLSYTNKGTFKTNPSGLTQFTETPGSWKLTGAVAVPEPTSGLLLLLGVAGLALKRRRA